MTDCGLCGKQNYCQVEIALENVISAMEHTHEFGALSPMLGHFREYVGEHCVQFEMGK